MGGRPSSEKQATGFLNFFALVCACCVQLCPTFIVTLIGSKFEVSRLRKKKVSYTYVCVCVCAHDCRCYRLFDCYVFSYPPWFLSRFFLLFFSFIYVLWPLFRQLTFFRFPCSDFFFPSHSCFCSCPSCLHLDTMVGGCVTTDST